MSEWPQESSLSITLNTGDWEKQLEDARQRARELERAAIVAWLREYDSRHPGFHNMRVTRNVANDIERGEHLRGRR